MNEWMNEWEFWIQWLEVGDVLLLNKKYPWFGGFLLQHITPGPKATHVIIISRIDKKGNTFFSHATEHLFKKKMQKSNSATTIKQHRTFSKNSRN